MRIPNAAINHEPLIFISAVLLLATSLWGQVLAPDPVAFINQPLVPAAVTPGGGPFTLIVNGTGFTPNSIVHWNGNPRTTTFVNSGRVTADILANDVVNASTAEVTVDNPATGGSGSTRSNIALFHVADPVASVTFNTSNLATGSSPESLALADFDGDGDLDIATGDGNEGTVSIFLNNGNGTFSSPTTQAITDPRGMTAADLNNDGKADLAISHGVSPGNVAIALGNGNGSFQTPVDYATGLGPFNIAPADFNADGFLDLAVATFSGPVSVLLGNGDGTFQSKLDASVSGIYVAAGDFNADGKLDLAVATGGGNSVSVGLGNGDGTFQTPTPYSTDASPRSIAAADFDDDGDLDLATANVLAPDNLSVLLGNGDGTFQASVEYTTGGSPTNIVAGDFSADGKLDLANTNFNGATASVLLGNGDGTFQTKTEFPAGLGPFAIAAHEFNDDGRLDLAVTNANGNTLSIMLLAPIAPAVQLSTASLNFSEQLVDITSPVMQVTLTNSGNATLNFTSFNVQLSTSDTTPSPHFSSNNTCGLSLGATLSCTINVFFTPLVHGPVTAVIAINSNAPGSPHFITLSGIGISDGAVGGLPANFDFGDQALGTTSPPHTFTLNNTGPGTLGISNIAVTGDFGLVSVGGDCGATVAATASCNIGVVFFSPLFPSVSGGTLTITHDGAGSPAVVILSGNGILVDPVALINLPLAPTSVAPGSGAFTLTVNGTGFAANSIVRWYGNARTTTFVNSSQLTAAIQANDVLIATTAEVAVDNPGTRSNIVFFHVTNPATSVAMSKTDFAVGDQPVFVATQDFNGDGLLDLAVANAQSVTVSILLGNGDGTFQPQSTIATGVGPFSVATGDFNADGQLDLAVANLSSNTVSILLGNGNGTFQANVEYATGSFPFSAITGDFNVDGKLDLAVANRSDDTVSILLGNGDGTFQTQTTFVTGSGPVSPMAGDFNGDGKLDLALANAFADTVSILLGSGTGTFSANVDFATGSNPVSVTTADLNADGKLDLAVANAQDDTVSILLGIGDGTFQAQTTYATGAFPISVTTGEFNGDDMLDLAVANSTDNTIGILNGIGDGTFQPQSTFATGLAPRFPAAGDFNGDGKLDLAVANRTDDTVSILLQQATATLLGPTPYLSQADSPFFADIQAGNMYLETFEDGLLNTPGVTASAGGPFGPGGLTDSVDADDGSIDGSGTNGHSFFSGDGPGGITFTFNATALGSFPTKAGIVWTDAGSGATATFEAFDSAGASLGVVGPTALADGSNSGTTAEDRFFGVTNPGGISKIHISNSSGGIEVDHLQYGLFTGASALSFDRASVNFSSINVGATSLGENIVITNSATFPVNFASISVTGDFAIKAADTNCPTTGGVLGAGASCNLDLEFSPTAAGPHLGIASIVSDASGSPHVIPLAGVGLAAGGPAVQFSPSSVNFAGNPLNLTCPTKPVTITNTGDVPLDITSVTATAPFSVTHNCPATLGVGLSCVANVKFSPTVVGNNQTGTLTVTTNPVTTGNTVALSGNGTPSCQLVAPRRSVTVLRGADAQDFAIEDAKPSCSPVDLNLTCSVDNPAACLLSPAVIAPSGASTLKVSNLRRVGADALQVLVTSTSEFRTASELVTVRFADFAFTKSADEATVGAGGSASYSMAIRPINGLSGNLTLACSGAPRGATCAVEPASITLDGTSVEQARVKVSTTGRAGALPIGGIDFGDGPRRILPLLIGLLALLTVAAASRRRSLAVAAIYDRRRRTQFAAKRLALAAMMLAMLAWASCGGGGSMGVGASGTPAGTYTLTITGTYSSSTGATPGTLANSTTVTLHVN